MPVVRAMPTRGDTAGITRRRAARASRTTAGILGGSCSVGDAIGARTKRGLNVGELRQAMADERADLRFRVCPRQDSNLRSRFRKPMLYPLSYEGEVSIIAGQPPFARLACSSATTS